MNRKIKKLKFLLIVIATFFTFSCTSYLENPFIDKQTGEDIDLLVIDASVFPVRLNIHLLDSVSETAIDAPATVSFSGKNQKDIITLSGKKQSEFHTSKGFLELALDPNVTVSAAEPLIFTIHVKAGENQESSHECIFESEGEKEIKVLL